MKDRISITMLEDGIADVRLIRADKMNALDPAMWSALHHAGFLGGSPWPDMTANERKAALARLEAQVAINMLLARFPNIAPGREQAVRRHLPAFRGFERMVVRL